MTPEDAKARHEEMIANVKEQTQVDEHFHHVNTEDKPTLYSDVIFKEAAIQWLIETDQVFIFCTYTCCIQFIWYISACVCIQARLLSAHGSYYLTSYLWCPDSK